MHLFLFTEAYNCLPLLFTRFARLSRLASLSGFGRFDVHLGLLDAGEDLLKKSLVLWSILTQPFIHCLHVLANAFDGLGGGGRLGGGRGRRRRGAHGTVFHGWVSGDGP